MGNCASGKTAEDKDEARKKRNIDQQNHNNSNNSARKRSNGESDPINRSKSSLNNQGGSRNSKGNINNNNNNMSPQQRGDDIDAKRGPSSPYAKGAAQATPSSSSYQQTNTYDDILSEFFNAVSNGDIECVEQILNSYEDKKKKRFKGDLLNAGMNKADGLTALSIAAGRKHRDLTLFLSGTIHFLF